MKRIAFFLIALLAFTLQGCKFYSFTGADIDYTQIKTFQVNNFVNNAPIVEPGIARDFTIQLQDLMLNQTSLDLVTSGGDLVYEGEIVEYRVSPMTATAEQRAAQNRLTIAVNVRFYNNTKEDANFEQRFSFFYDYPATSQLASVRDEAHREIFERINQEIFNRSLADW